jgi:hypothetical protein
MEWIPVNIIAYRYSELTKQLQVKYKDGAVYCFFDVPSPDVLPLLKTGMLVHE